MNTNKLQSIFIAAVLVFSAAATALVVPQTAYAAVAINSSADQFFGPSLIRFEIRDDALVGGDSGDDETINVTVEARSGSTSLGTATILAEEIGTSGTFEVFVTTSNTLVPAAPTFTEDGEDPFVVRISPTAAAGNANEAALVTSSALKSGDTVRVTYGGTSKTVNFSSDRAILTADRTIAGEDNEIVLRLADKDANTDPTAIDSFTLASALTSNPTITYPGGATWTESGQNTGVFELTVVVNGAAPDNFLTATLPIGSSFTATDHDVYEVIAGATAPFNVVTPTSTTSSASVTLRNSNAVVTLQGDPTLANGLKVQLTDADRNISTEDEDDVSADVRLDVNGDGTIDPDGADNTVGTADDESVALAFAETGDNTGIFLPDFDRDTIAITVGNAHSLLNNRITIDIDDIEADIRLVYTDPAFQSNGQASIITELKTIPGELSTEMDTVGITGDAEITLEDSDLNTNPNTIETYDASNGEFLINGVVVGEFTVVAGDEEVDSGDFSATFIETGANTGIFVADDVDISEIDSNIAGALDDGEEIEFTYNDLMEDPAEDSDVSITIGVPDAGISVDRSTIPVPTLGDAVTIVLTVVDPSENDNSGSIDEVTVPLADIVVRNGNGATITNDADVTTFTGIAGNIILRETGPNTGIFEDDVELEPAGSVDLDDLVNARVTFEYDDDTVSVTLRSFDGRITASPSVVSTGNEFTVTVTDQDLNKDPDTRETIDVDFETDEDTDDGTIELTETGPNTGVFTEEVEVGTDINVVDGNDFTTEITLTYTDAITSAGDEDEERETTVRVATSTGRLVVEPEVVGPGTEITLTLIDTDLNENPNGKDSIEAADKVVEITSSDGDKGNIGFEETGPNTGIFEATIQFEPRDPEDDGELTGSGDEWTYTALPGDVIAFRYTDETNASGNKVVVSTSFRITSVDPEMSAAARTVQIGGTIELTIEDSDANRDADSLDSVDVEITSDSDPVGFTLSALETEENSGVFTVDVPTSATVTSGSIYVKANDDVFLEYTDEFPSDYADRVDTVLDPSKDFVLVIPVGTSITTDTGATTPEPVVPRDISNNELDEISRGQQVVLSTVVNNNRNVDMDYAAIIEVRDSDGFTVSLQWATGTLPAGDEVGVGLSWTPTEAGTYTVRTFVLSSVENPAALSTIVTSTLTVS